MACDVRPYIRLKKSLRNVLYLSITILIIIAVFLSLNSNKQSRIFGSSKRTFDVFDPVHGILPGQRQLSGQSPDNVLGLSRRESKLVDRVHDVEDENRRLKHHLSVSQNQGLRLHSYECKPLWAKSGGGKLVRKATGKSTKQSPTW